MLQKALFMTILLCMLLTGCKGRTLSSQEVLSRMGDADTYTSESIMKVQNNKSVFTYNLKQYYKRQDKYRVEFYDDTDCIMQTIIYNGNKCGVFHTSISKPFISDNFIGTKEHSSFLSAFIANYKKDEKAEEVMDKSEGNDYYIFTCKLDNQNSYFKKSILKVDAKNAVPKLLTILGENDNKTIEISYANFSYNVPIDDLLFNLEY